MLKKTVAAGVDIDVMKRNVNLLVDRNANMFNLLAEDYTKLSRGPLPEDLFSTFTAEEFFGNEETSIENKDVDLFGNRNEETVNLFQIGDEETMDLFGEPMHETYV